MNFSGFGELHRRAGRQDALQDGLVGCTLRQAGGLQKRASRKAALFCRSDRPFPQSTLLSSVQPAENSCFSFGNTAFQFYCLMFTIVVGVLSAMASCSAPFSCWLSHIMKVVSILPAIFWRQQIGWSHCAGSQDSVRWHDAIQRKRLLCQENAVLLVV